MQPETALHSLGLTSNEIKVYLALLQLGKATVTPLRRSTKLHGSRVYEALHGLSSKGLAKYVVLAKKKQYHPLEPDRLVGVAFQLEQEVRQAIPFLNSIKKKEDVEQTAEIYEGIKGIKSVLDLALEVLKPGETYYILGAPKIANEKLEGFLLNTHQRRVKKKVKLKIIYHQDAKKFGKIREKMKYTDVRYIGAEQVPSWIEIFGDYVATYLLSENPLIFVVRNKDVARSYKIFFDIIWKRAKPQPL